MDFKMIDLEWEERFAVTYDRDLDQYQLDKAPDELLDKSGLYQIYGRHPIYGNDVLLYIGETKENEGESRNFQIRLGEHLKSKFYCYTNLSISLAPCSENSEAILDIESVLIHSHQPALNRIHLESHRECNPPILIRNWGFVGSLEGCCTSFWGDVENVEICNGESA